MQKRHASNGFAFFFLIDLTLSSPSMVRCVISCECEHSFAVNLSLRVNFFDGQSFRSHSIEFFHKFFSHFPVFFCCFCFLLVNNFYFLFLWFFFGKLLEHICLENHLLCSHTKKIQIMTKHFNGATSLFRREEVT